MGKGGYVTIKVDIDKAFDKVEWNMFCRILCALSFLSWFICLIL